MPYIVHCGKSQDSGETMCRYIFVAVRDFCVAFCFR